MAKEPQRDDERPPCRSDGGKPHGDHGSVEEGIDLARGEGTAKVVDVHDRRLDR